jgi:hypothetical protein
MADTVTTQYQLNDARNAVVILTNVSDGTGEANVLKVDASSAGLLGVTKWGQTFYPGVHLTIMGIDYDIGGMSARLQWQATANKDIMPLAPGSQYFRDFSKFGGLQVPAGLPGATGGICLTTLGAVNNATYWIALYLRKNV